MIWVILLESLLLVTLLSKLAWDVVRYRRSGHLPWVARHLCWTVPGRSRQRWSPQWGGLCDQRKHEEEREDVVQEGYKNIVKEYNDGTEDTNDDIVREGVRFMTR